MFKSFCVVFFISVCSLFVGYAQENGLTDKERIEKGNYIIENARKDIGIYQAKSAIDSFQLSMKSINNLKQTETTTTKEFYILLPDKILSISSVTKPFDSKSTSVLNGGKYKELSEFVSPDGQRTVRDVTNRSLNNNLADFVKDKETLEKFKKASTKDPKEKLNNDIWSDVFPIILNHPFETKAEFKYMGIAKSVEGEANIVDTTSASGRSIRLLFDSKTNQLLSMFEKFKGFDGDYENNYYYSNRELMDKVLIPKKIKVEHKFTPPGKDAKVSYTYIDVLDFKINPKFKSNLFDVN